MMKRTLAILAGVFFLACISSAGWAKMTSEEIARLDKDLTPMGAERAGNGDGTIPEWTGGIQKWPAGYQHGMHHPDPYADDKVLFTITAANMDQYADKISEGHKAMLKTYGSFQIKVYPTRRSASSPRACGLSLRPCPRLDPAPKDDRGLSCALRAASGNGERRTLGPR